MKLVSKRLWLIYSALALSTTIVFIGEIIARHQIAIEEKSRTPVYVADLILGYRLKPNLDITHKALGKGTPEIPVHTTPQGFRDNQIYSYSKPLNTFRILMLGDSFIQGDEVPLEKTISKLLEQKLNQLDPDLNYQVINAAWRGSNPLQQYLWFKTEGIKFNPDLVIVNFYVGNDVDDVLMFNIESDSSGLAEKLTLKDTYIDSDGYLKRNPSPRRINGILSRINILICDPLYLCKYYLRPLTDKVLNQLGLGKYYPIWSPDWFAFLWPDLSLEMTSAWQLTQKHIVAIKTLAQQQGSDFILTTIPFDHQVDPAKWSKALKVMTRQELEDMAQNAYPQQRLKYFAQENKITLIDFLPQFRLTNNSQKLYFPSDFHWNPAGHQLAAQLILKALEDYGHLL